MKKNDLSRIFAAVCAALSLILAAGVKLVFHACAAKEDGTWMNCHWAQETVFWFAAGMLAVSLIAAIVKNARVRQALLGILIALCAAQELIPNTLIHLCMMPEMRCRAIMRPSVLVLAAITLVCAAIGLIFSVRKQK